MHIPKAILPFSPCVEGGWRLARKCWGFGYAPEAANEGLLFAFDNLKLDEVVAFTAVGNLKSQSVMKKIGMVNTHQDFKHPDIDPGNQLCNQVLFKITSFRCKDSSF